MAKSRRRSKPRAETADRHDLYELAVQDPPSEVAFTTTTFRKLRGREAMRLREDFCGTAVFSLEWVRSHPERSSVGVDLDRETLDWSLEHRIEPAGKDVAARIELRCANVLDRSEADADIAVAFNFSYWCFDTREALLDYFEIVREHIVADGLLVLDAYGGTEVPMADINEREVEDEQGVINGGEPYTYIWQQHDFNPIDSRMSCAIHFEFEDGSELRNAFTYDWRIWSLRELTELLHEAGFVHTRVWIEDEDEDGEGTGTYSEVEVIDNEGVWWAYITAEKVESIESDDDDDEQD